MTTTPVSVPSGSGKSTLLRCINGRYRAGVSGPLASRTTLMNLLSLGFSDDPDTAIDAALQTARQCQGTEK